MEIEIEGLGSDGPAWLYPDGSILMEQRENESEHEENARLGRIHSHYYRPVPINIQEYKEMSIKPEPNIHIIKFYNKYPNKDCAICFNKLSNRKKRNIITNCTKNEHIFHANCIIELFSHPVIDSRTNSRLILGFRHCPLCRRKISLYKLIKDKKRLDKKLKKSRKKSRKR
jgi:hypothetical protein